MTDTIEPALSAEQHREQGYVGENGHGVGIVDGTLVALIDGAIGPILDPAPTIAVANAALDDDDRRKVTREWVTAMRAAAQSLRDVSDEVANSEEWGEALAAPLEAFADALASYLPPEGS